MKYLHTMVRVTDVDASLKFYCDALGLEVIKRNDYPQGRFTLIFLAAPGDSDAQVLAFLTSRYGDFVLLNPRFGWRTLLLWLIPAGLLLGGAAVLALAIRNRRGSVGAGTALSAAEEARVAKLLDEIDRPASREHP